MAKLSIITAPDPRLKVKCRAVDKVDDSVRRLMDDMLETMYAAPGIGLAAPQVGDPRRVLVLDIARDDEPPQPLRFANPEIVWASEEEIVHEEGCLSVPEHYAEVKRPAEVKVRYIDYENEIREMHAKGLLSVCLQHEMEHLEGVLFIDHLSRIKRDIILRKLSKQRKSEAREPV
jgi:peptide deformylase